MVANASEVPQTISDEFLQYFWQLPSVDAAERQQSGVDIIQHLQALESSDNQRELKYALQRLVRGLASSRDAARQGFSATLTLFLQTFPSFASIDETLKLIRETTQISTSMKAMEQRERMFGRLFGYMAIYRSGRLAEDTAIHIVEKVLEIAAWRKWIREVAFDCVLCILRCISCETFEEKLLPIIMEQVLNEDISSWNAEQVGLAAGIQRLFSEREQECSDDKIGNFVSLDNLKDMVEPLRTTSATYPRVHSAWFHVFSNVFQTNSFDKQEGAIISVPLDQVWQTLIDESMIESTHERKGTAFKVFELILPLIPDDGFDAILSPKFIRCLYNNSLAGKAYLHRTACHAMKRFYQVAPETFFFVMKSIFCHPHKCSEAIADAEEGLKQMKSKKDSVVDALVDLEEKKDTEEYVARRIDAARIWVLEVLADAIRDPSVLENRALLKDIATFVLYHGCFTNNANSSKSSTKRASLIKQWGEPSPALSDHVRTICQERLLLFVNPGNLDFMPELRKKSKKSKADKQMLQQPEENRLDDLIAIHVLDQCKLFEASGLALVNPLSDEHRKLFEGVMGALQKMSKKVSALIKKQSATENAREFEAYGILLAHIVFLLFDPNQSEDCAVALDDLLQCYDKLYSTKKSKTKADEQPLAVFVDALLSLLTHDSKVLRSIIKLAFKVFGPRVYEEATSQMVEIICRTDNGEEREEEEDDDFMPIDKDDPSNDEDEGEDEDGDEDGDDDDEEDIVLSSSKDIAKVMHQDDDLEAMKREDAALSNIVRLVKEKSSARQDAKKLRTHETHFKLRVLDLLQLHLEKVSPSVALAECFILLLKLINSKKSSTPEQRTLQSRSFNFLKQIVSKANNSIIPEEHSTLEPEQLQQMLIVITQLVTNKSSPLMTSEMNHLCGAIFAFIMNFVSLDDEDVVTAAKEAMELAARSYFQTKNTKMKGSFFDEFLRLQPSYGWRILAESLTNRIQVKNGAISNFALSEAFRLMETLLKKYNKHEEAEKAVFSNLAAKLQKAYLDSLTLKMKTKRAKAITSLGQALVRALYEPSAKSAKALKAFYKKIEATDYHHHSPSIKSIIAQTFKFLENPQDLKASKSRKRKHSSSE